MRHAIIGCDESLLPGYEFQRNEKNNNLTPEQKLNAAY